MATLTYDDQWCFSFFWYVKMKANTINEILTNLVVPF